MSLGFQIYFFLKAGYICVCSEDGEGVEHSLALSLSSHRWGRTGAPIWGLVMLGTAALPHGSPFGQKRILETWPCL